MKHVIDVVILLAVSILLIVGHPLLGVLLLLANSLFAIQYWKTVLLIGDEQRRSGLGRKIKALLLALLFGASIVLISQSINVGDAQSSVSALWNEELFPAIVGICALSSLLMTAIVTERRKR